MVYLPTFQQLPHHLDTTESVHLPFVFVGVRFHYIHLPVIMQIRLWTLYDCSRKILVFMGLAFLSEVIAMTTIFGVMAQGTVGEQIFSASFVT